MHMHYKTELLDAAKSSDINRALELLSQGELVAVPTETVYGLAADACNDDAVKKIFIAKGRPANHPLIVHIASVDNLAQWAKDIPEQAYILAKKFWPGPLTLLLRKCDDVSSVVTGGRSTIALRVPRSPVLLEILIGLKTGLAAPSANPHKRISPTTAAHVLAGLDGKIAAVLDGGVCSFGLESTIVDLTSDVVRILRPGPIAQKDLEEILGCPVEAFVTHDVAVAGNMKVHYQPRTKAVLMTLDEIINFVKLRENQNKKIGVMSYSLEKLELMGNVHLHTMSRDKTLYAQALYAVLHQLDAQGFDVIVVEMPPKNDFWADVIDRLVKACACEE